MRFQATEQKVKVTGRTLFVEGIRYLGYSASSVTFTFVGKKAVADIWSDADAWGEETKGYIAVYVDDGEEPVKRICLEQPENVYTLYESNEEKKVTITIMKYSEAKFGHCGIRYLEIDTDKLCPPPAAGERRMEIIGDSITCGYSVETENELQPFHTAFENPTKAYSLLTAKELGAEVNLVSWSGNGILSSYVEETATAPSDECLMPTLYLYTDISGSEKLFGRDESKWERWDFSRFVPDIILINLGTNDSSWCKDIRDRKDNFRDRYVEFLKEIRENNPGAQLLCMLGTMDQRLLKEVESAVGIFAGTQKDEKVHFLALPPQSAEDGYVGQFHPSVLTHRKTARLVVDEVRRIMNWQTGDEETC
ncbi:MAG: GDSL-type esterase/lipase family protein [Acetatifactor sp.]